MGIGAAACLLDICGPGTEQMEEAKKGGWGVQSLYGVAGKPCVQNLTTLRPKS